MNLHFADLDCNRAERGSCKYDRGAWSARSAPLEIEAGHVLTICRYCGSQLIGELGDRPVTRVKARPVLSQSERERAYVRSQLASVEAEIWSLERQRQTDTTWQQPDLLRAQERTLKARLRYWQNDGAPASVAKAPLAHAE